GRRGGVAMRSVAVKHRFTDKRVPKCNPGRRRTKAQISRFAAPAQRSHSGFELLQSELPHVLVRCILHHTGCRVNLETEQNLINLSQQINRCLSVVKIQSCCEISKLPAIVFRSAENDVSTWKRVN